MRGADPRFVRVAGNGYLLGAYEARRGVAPLFLSALRAKLLDQLRTRAEVVLNAVGVGVQPIEVPSEGVEMQKAV
jgi:hypothetical protein